MQLLTQGDSPVIDLRIRDIDDNLVDLTGHTATVQVKIEDEAHDDVSAVVDSNQVANKGKVRVSLTPAILDKAGLLELRVKLQDAGGKILTNLDTINFKVREAF